MIAQCLRTAAFAGILGFAPVATFAGEAWNDVRDILFEDRSIDMGASELELNVPYRTADDRRTLMNGHVALAGGALIHKVYLVIDENPMPVSAVFEMDTPTASFDFGATMRLNGPSGVHLVVETDGGALLAREGAIKTSGLGACAAPPGTDPELALKTLGQMRMDVAQAAPSARLAALASGAKEPAARHVTVNFSHPSHSGLQMDQITLLYLPARYIETVAVAANDVPFFTLTGSISLSENPAISFDVPPDTGRVSVHMTDTEGAEFTQAFALDHS